MLRAKPSSAGATALFLALVGAAAPFAACGSPEGATSAPRADDAGSDGGILLASDAAVPPDADGEGSAADAGLGDGATDASEPLDANGPPFPCGPTLVCFEVTQFCSQVTGPHGGVFYDCNEAPSPCTSDLSCTCLAAQGISSPCTESDGGITVVAVE